MQKNAGDTVFTRFVAPENPGRDMEGLQCRNAAVNADPWLNAIVDDLQPYAAQYPVLEKSVYSSRHSLSRHFVCADSCETGVQYSVVPP